MRQLADILLAIALGMAIPATAPSAVRERPALTGEPVIFSVVGDVPYDSLEIAVLQQHFDNHDLYSPAEFLVHVGDIKSDPDLCDEFWYESMATMLRSLSVPAFIVPGDNEWTDCLDRVVGWQYWTKHLMGIENSFCGAPQVEKQAGRPENFAFVLKGVLFVGINLVGGQTERQSMLDDADWVYQQFTEKDSLVRAAVVFAQAGPSDNRHWFFDRFEPDAAAFAKPVLYAQGDGHFWLLDQPFLTAPNVTRVQVERGIVPPLQVTVESDATFHFERDPWPAGTVAVDRPPCADAGPDLIVPEDGVATLYGKVSDDGEPLPTQFSAEWSVVEGGTALFADPHAVLTTVTFEDDGIHVLRLTASDGQSVATDEITVTVGGTGPNLPPVAQRDAYEMEVDGTLWVDVPGVLANDTDANGNALVAELVTPPAHGELTLASDGSFTYVPGVGYVGLDHFVYRASDTVEEDEAEAWIGVGGTVMTFVPVADAKVRSNQPASNYGHTTDLRVEQDVMVLHSYLRFNLPSVGTVRDAMLRLYSQSGSIDGGTIHAVSNNYEGTTTPWTETGITWGNAPALTGSALSSAGLVLTDDLVELPLGAAITGPGTWSFALQNGVPDAVIYGSRESNLPPELIVCVLPAGADLPPVAAADAFSTPEDSVLTVAAPGVLGNDVDADGDSLTSTLAAPPVHGVAALALDGSFTYTPAADFQGTDAFSYVLDDGEGGSDTGIVTLTVTPMNDLPALVNDIYAHRSNENLDVAVPGVLWNDTDPDADSLTVTVVVGPTHGSLSLAPDGAFAYAPDGSGLMDGFDYEASDGQAVSRAHVTLRLLREPKTHTFTPSEGETGGPSKASALPSAPASERARLEGPAAATTTLTFRLFGLGPHIVQATLRLHGGEPPAWLERDVTPWVQGDGSLSLELAPFVPDGFVLGPGNLSDMAQLVIVTEGEPEAPVVEPAGQSVERLETRLYRVMPNPTRQGVWVDYGLAQSERAEIILYNARGQRVRTLASERQSAGRKLLFWDGTDARGARVPAGIYFLRSILGPRTETRKVVVAR
ncbi:MAG TPA: Ig-like domain-containing protein [Candidatus Krumholzibacteria bacterium]|nr:Ig-like domain-containing protein [Candidatus Krumholzibacteria bacterium]